MGKFSDTMRWLAREVRSEPGKKDVIVNPCTFITGTHSELFAIVDAKLGSWRRPDGPRVSF